MKKIVSLLTFGFVLLASFAGASEVVHPGGFPSPVGPVAEKVVDIYNFIFWITAVIAAIVAGVVGICIWKFRASKVKKAATFSHSTVLELVWTAIPALICLSIAWYSYLGIQFIRTMPEEGITVEAIAYQFGWDFDYPDYEMSAAEPTEPHATLSIPSVDRYVKDMVVPVDTVVKLHLTARDVIHAFYAPDLGIKIDAVPGRINYQWFKATKEGDYIGQCAELCGAAHGEMFFNVKVVSKEEFKKWVNTQRAENDLAALKTIEL